MKAFFALLFQKRYRELTNSYFLWNKLKIITLYEK